jgi:uncharacterized membrane protein YoaK (UPF0700 family)
MSSPHYVIEQEGTMTRERALKVVLVLAGLLFSAGIYPRTMSLWKMNESDYGDDMMLSLYFALGIFLLMAVRNPSANRSLIAFAAWSSFAHGAVMAVLAIHIASERAGLLSAVAALVFIGVALIAPAPAKQAGERASAAGA